MNKIKILFLSVFFILTLQQCTSPTGPPIKKVKNPRTYTWTIDTLKISASTQLTSVWGSSPNDVYIGGGDATGSLWHYDGKKWSVVSLPENTRWYVINGIYGFSAGDVWAVGYRRPKFTYKSLICHFDGSSWKKFIVTGGGRLQAVWGSSSSDVWATGSNTLLHFDGVGWNKFPFFFPPQGVSLTSISGTNSNNIYMTGRGFRNDAGDTTFYYLYYYNGSMWSVANSSYTTASVDARKFGAILKTIGGTLYSADYKLFKKEGANWVIINDDPLIISLGGSSTDNLFAAGINGTVYHYNGTDWQKIIIKEGFREAIYDVWTDGTEAFMVSEDGSRTFVIHGK